MQIAPTFDQAKFDAVMYQRMIRHCKNEHGHMVRGQVSIAVCPGCKTSRLEDGTACQSCGSYTTACRVRIQLGWKCHRCPAKAIEYRYGILTCGSDPCNADARLEYEKREADRRKRTGLAKGVSQ